MAIKIITGPAAEPITLDEAKLQCRVEPDVTVEDALIEAMIVAAREGAEALTGRALMPQTLEYALDEFPSLNYRTSYNRAERMNRLKIALPRPPLASIISFKYIDQDGVEQTIAPGDYQLDNYAEPARLLPAVDGCWPATRCQINAVIIRYTAGYADADAVPQQIKNWMLLRVAMMYENREEFLVGASIQAMPFVDGLLDPYKIWNL